MARKLPAAGPSTILSFYSPLQCGRWIGVLEYITVVKETACYNPCTPLLTPPSPSSFPPLPPSREVYDPEFLARPGKALRDLILPYSVVDYVCPLLVFKGTPWIPSLQL